MNTNQEEPSKIENLKKSLYSRAAPDVRTKRRVQFEQKNFDVKTNWDRPEEKPFEELTRLNRDSDIESDAIYEKRSMSYFAKFLVASLVFFVGAVGVGAYLFFNGSNIVSTNNVDIAITGPVSIAGGDVFDMNVQVLNKNSIKLEVVDLSATFPSGTANPDDVTKEMKDYRQLLDNIEPGGVSEKTVRAALFGEENTKKTILFKVEYRIAGSNAVFTKEKSYEVLVSSSPISLSISTFKEVTSGQDFDVTIDLTSNSKDTLHNIVLKGVYPTGFTFASSDPKPVGNTSTWKIGDLPSKGSKKIVIKGRIEGQNDESRVFRFMAGAQGAKNDKTIGTEYIATVQNIKIRKPFISVGIEIGGESTSGYGAYTGGRFNTSVEVNVSWFNNLDVAITNAEIHAKLSGSAFDKYSVSPGEGLYRSADNEIVWNKMTTNSLASVPPGGEGKISFNLIPRDPSGNGRSVVNPNVVVDVDVKGARLSESDVPESVVSSAAKIIKIGSSISTANQVVRSATPFANTGPIPPKIEQQTTYTIIWSVYNTSSNVSGAQLTATLPPYAKWLGKVNPSSEDVRHSESGGQIVWNIGNVPAYTGHGGLKREIAFQVGITPSASQIGQILSILSESNLTGIDDYTGLQVKDTKPFLDTRFSDPSYKFGDETVVR